MELIEYMPYILPAIGSAIISVLFTVFLVRKASSGIGDSLTELMEAQKIGLQTQLKPIMDTNSRAMGILNSKSVDVRQEKAALKHLGSDLLNQNEILIEALRGIAPGFADYIETRPELVIKLMPRIEQLLERQGGIEGLLGSPSPSRTQPHPFLTEI